LVSTMAADYQLRTFSKQQLSNEFHSEGAGFGDFNKDGVNDIVSGPYWYEGPSFQKKHEYYKPTEWKKKSEDGQETTQLGYDPLGYSKNFFAYSHDINADGWTDIVILGFPGEASWWFANPGKAGSGHWTRHTALDATANESPAFTDITGDGKPEIVCASKGAYGYAEPEWSDPTKPWKWRNITPNNNYHHFTHGMGVGDINGDGKADLLEKDGWWQNPGKVEGDTPWTKHAFQFTKEHGGSQMFAYDVDGDGDNDVIAALAAHGYGLAWYEHVKEDGKITFKTHKIMGSTEAENKYGVKFSQLHAVDLADIDNDGLKDIITGKRWWAHGPKGDAEPNAAAVVYWFKLKRGSDGVDFVPFQADDDSGVGTQVTAGDVNKDGNLDIVVGNKRGTFVLTQQVKSATREEYEKAQPKPVGTAQ
jgi:hypothetical protein